MKLQYFIFWVLSITLISCGSTKNTPSEEQFNTLALLVKTQSFSIESDWAYPQATYALQQVLNSGLLQPGNSSNAINLIGNSNFLTIKGDSITSYLPYFGERQMNLQYGGGDSAIQFSGLLEDYKITKNNNGVDHKQSRR